MTQQLKQDVVVDITVKGGDQASKVLTTIETKLKSIAAQARRVSTALGSLNKVNGTQKMNNELSSVNKTMDASTRKARKLNTIWKNMDGSKKIVPLATVKTPKTVTMTDLSPAVTSMGMKTPKAAGSALASNEAAKAAAATGNASAKAAAGVNKFQRSLDSAGKSAKTASWNFFRTRAAIAAVAMVATVLGTGVKKWFDLASDYAEANHLFYTTLASSLNDVADAEKTASIEGKDLFGNTTGESVAVTQAVADAANEVERLAGAMMLDPTQMKRTYATFYEMANSAGMATDKIMKLSQGMTQLTYDLASLWDFSFEEVSSKLQSGISGISTSVRSLGIDISRTAADHWLLTNGIDATYRALTRADKMVVMYNMLMEHTITAQGDLARSALQPANMLRILSEQARLAARMMGGAIFPVLTKLIPLFIMFAQAIQTAATTLSNFLGLKLGNWYAESQEQWNSYMANLDSSFSGGGIDLGEDETEDALEGVGDAATDTGKKLKEMTNFTLPFDELNMLNEAMSGGVGSGGGAGGLGGGLGDLNIPMLDPYKWDQDINSIILGDAAKTLGRLKTLIDSMFGTGTVDAFSAALDNMGAVASDNFTRIKDSIGQMVTAFLGLFDWPEVIRGFADGFNMVTTAITDVIAAWGPFVAGFLELEPVKKFFQDNSYEIGKFLGVIAGAAAVVVGFNVAAKILEVIMSPIGKIFQLAIGPILGVGRGLMALPGIIAGLPGAFTKIGTKIGTFLGVESGGGLRGIIGVLTKIPGPVGAVLTVLAILGGAFVTLMTTDEEFAAKVEETWVRIQEAFAVVGEIIQPLLDQLNEALKKIAEAFGLVIDPATGLWDTIAQMLQPVLELLLPLVEGLAYFLGGAFITALTVVTGAISILANMVEGAMTILGGIFDVFKGLGEFLTGIFTGDLTKVQDGFDLMSGGVQGIVEGLFGAVTGIFTGLGDTVVSILEGLGIDASGIWEGIKGGISGIVEGITGFVGGAFDTLSGTVSSIWEGIGTFMSDPIGTAKGVISGIIDTIKGLFNFDFRLPDIKLPHFRWSTTTVLGITIPSFSGVDWYAKGGIFDKATVAGIGEAGPEAVVPLQGARMRPFADAIASNLRNVNTGGKISSSGLDGEALVAAMSTAVYNAVVKGFPSDIKINNYMDSTKVNSSLKTNNIQQGVGTSLVR